MRQKAVLIEFRGVAGINAETVISRHFDLKALHEVLSQVQDLDNWRIPNDHIRPTLNWSVEWTPELDAKLLVGVWKYGLGSWETVRDDPSLMMKGKVFLDDVQSKGKKLAERETRLIPNAIHLVRRADYASGLVRDSQETARLLREQQSVYANSSTARPSSHAHSHSHHSEPGPSSRGESSSSHGKKGRESSVSETDAKGKRKSTPVYTDSENESD
jgi:chromodomain-helicase-DNA-binding protein 1